MNFGDTIKEKDSTSLYDCAKTMIFIRRHPIEELKSEYLIVTEPFVFWKNLKNRFDHQKAVIPPKARSY